MNKKLFLFIIFLVMKMNAQQLPLPYLRQVELRITVVLDSVKGIYFYTYSIKNGSTSVGDLDGFEIDVSRKSTDIELNDVGLTFKNAYIEGRYRRMYPGRREWVVPLSFPYLPRYGDAGLTVRNTASLEASSIKPDQEEFGFVISSKALPGIRWFFAEPPFDPNDYYPSMEYVDNPDSLIDKVDQDREAIKYYGYTIGPTAPPKIFIPTVWCDTLTGYTTQSRSLGWIKDQATTNKYLNYFATAKDSLQHNKVDTARGFLRQVLHDVDIDSTSNITSEAYALLRYNTEYLLEHILDQYVTLSLGAGWSMVSVPLLQSNYDADAVFPGKYGAMFGCNMIIQDYEEAENLACGLGYWVYYINPTTVTISGLIPDTVSVTSPGGWVMLGSRHTPVQVSSLQLSNGAIVYGAAFGYDQVLGDYVETTVINPGDAVWLYVTKACTITIP